ncbi:MAG: hypothetical protein HQ503_15630 [Rhodospirillales bacterium]|nr:hypothetical protein [Rhodospirillales bacterium]
MGDNLRIAAGEVAAADFICAGNMGTLVEGDLHPDKVAFLRHMAGLEGKNLPFTWRQSALNREI